MLNDKNGCKSIFERLRFRINPGGGVPTDPLTVARSPPPPEKKILYKPCTVHNAGICRFVYKLHTVCFFREGGGVFRNCTQRHLA